MMEAPGNDGAIRPRRVAFDWAKLPLDWVPGERQTSHTIDVLHLLLPAGEKWFVKVFHEALPHLEDAAVRDAVRGFMGQEAIHGRAHAAVLEHLAARGIDTRPYTRRVDWLFERALASRPFGRAVPRPLERAWLVHRVALVAAIEHHTAFLAEWVLSHDALDRAGADATMMDMLRWHASEEVEHRSVAFDAAVAMDIGWLHRAVAQVEATAALIGFWRAGIVYLMRADGATATLGAFTDAGRRGLLPTLGHVAREIPRYFVPGYHPSATSSPARAAEYLARSPAVRAAEGRTP